MESLCALLFELSNEDRLRILHELDVEAMNVTNLSKALDLTTQESSRHVSRLGAAGLTQKTADGSHRLTFYGKLVLRQLNGLDFVSKHRNYFASHTVARVPPEFVCRIGELADSTYTDDVMAVFYNVDRVFGEAEENIWVITDQYLVSTWYPATTEALERQVKVKQIEAKDWVVPPKMKEGIRAKDIETARRARVTGHLEEKILEQLGICLYLSEKEVGGVAFPFPDGRFDYLGFTATDENSLKWCSDIFQYYWEKARDRAKAVEELYVWAKKRPKVASALKKIAVGKEIVNRKEVISELDRMGLTKQGKLTKLGDLVYDRLQQ